MTDTPPTAFDLEKDRGLTIQWASGTSSYFTIAYRRRMSPSAEARELREQMAKDPLTVVPASAGKAGPGQAEACPGVRDVVAHAGEPLERVEGLEASPQRRVHAGATEDGLVSVEVPRTTPFSRKPAK